MNHLTPKEKAEDIFKKYYSIVEDVTEGMFDEDSDYIDARTSTAQQSAIFHVDEIIKSGPMHPHKLPKYEFWSDQMDEAILYWVEVKKEIEKL